MARSLNVLPLSPAKAASASDFAGIYGQFNPRELGNLICHRESNAHLCELRIYTGRPVADKEPKTYAANMKQCATWEKDGITVTHRSLRYPSDWPVSKATEKGIDVALVVDFVALAIDKKYDIGVIASRLLLQICYKSKSKGLVKVDILRSNYITGRQAVGKSLASK